MAAAEGEVPSRTELLRVKSVGKSYGDVKALQDLTLSVDAGEFVALLGPNGAGKTTLFQLLTGLFVADEGHIVICGWDLSTHATKALADLGVVFQQPTLDLDLGVRANLKLHARLHGLGANSAERIDAELARVGLLEHARKSARTLSGGNRRRVELARALVHSPALLLMDEATVGLDPASRHALLTHVNKLCAEDDVGVLWATHLVDEAEDADRVLVLDRGRLLAEGSPEHICRQVREQRLEDAFLEWTTGSVSE